MRTVVIVIVTLLFDHCPDLGDRSEDIGIKKFPADIPVKSFNKGILHRFPRLDEDQLDLVYLTPAVKRIGDELRTVIHPDHPREIGINSKSRLKGEVQGQKTKGSGLKRKLQGVSSCTLHLAV